MEGSAENKKTHNDGEYVRGAQEPTEELPVAKTGMIWTIKCSSIVL